MSATELERGVSEVLIDEDALRNRIAELGEEISRDYAGREPLPGVEGLTGAIQLERADERPVALERQHERGRRRYARGSGGERRRQRGDVGELDRELARIAARAVKLRWKGVRVARHRPCDERVALGDPHDRKAGAGRLRRGACDRLERHADRGRGREAATGFGECGERFDPSTRLGLGCLGDAHVPLSRVRRAARSRARARCSGTRSRRGAA